MREPFLSEIDAPPRRRSLTLATPQKRFLRIFCFARSRFFLIKEKEIFFAGLCSERAGRRGFAFRAGGQKFSSPQTPLQFLPACLFAWRSLDGGGLIFHKTIIKIIAGSNIGVAATSNVLNTVT